MKFDFFSTDFIVNCHQLYHLRRRRRILQEHYAVAGAVAAVAVAVDILVNMMEIKELNQNRVTS